jgi:hypothetical protein
MEIQNVVIAQLISTIHPTIHQSPCQTEQMAINSCCANVEEHTFFALVHHPWQVQLMAKLPWLCHH